MKSFWPKRSNPKGFSIEMLARKYREKISDINSQRSLKEIVDNGFLDSLKEEKKPIIGSQIYMKKVHWANRDFSEYRDVA